MKKVDLENVVDELNNKYCGRSKVHLKISQAYGGYSVIVTPKLKKHGTGVRNVGNDYHDTINNTIAGLYKAEAKGWVKNSVNSANESVKLRISRKTEVKK